MVPITPFGIVATLLIGGLLAFWLFAPTGTVASSLNFTGGLIQSGLAKVKSFFAWVRSWF
jgi:hypothetical protein